MVALVFDRATEIEIRITAPHSTLPNHVQLFAQNQRFQLHTQVINEMSLHLHVCSTSAFSTLTIWTQFLCSTRSMCVLASSWKHGIFRSLCLLLQQCRFSVWKHCLINPQMQNVQRWNVFFKVIFAYEAALTEALVSTGRKTCICSATRYNYSTWQHVIG